MLAYNSLVVKDDVNAWLSGLHLLSARMTGMCHYAQLSLDRRCYPSLCQKIELKQ